ncbi:MAG: hypothetical protein ACHQ4F_15980, partial [Candidatus Dormibacteria bacterium]
GTLDGGWAPAELRGALTAPGPADGGVRAGALRNDGFDARRDAVDRTYRYLIVCRDGGSPVMRRNAWTVRGPLDLDAMRRAAAHLVGKHDFAAFGSSPRPGGSTLRHVTSVAVERAAIGSDDAAQQGDPVLETIVITVHADAFLRGMMRSFTGALVKIGQGRAAAEWLASLVDTATTRDPTVSVAPARGLHQWSVRYGSPSNNQELAA